MLIHSLFIQSDCLFLLDVEIFRFMPLIFDAETIRIQWK